MKSLDKYKNKKICNNDVRAINKNIDLLKLLEDATINCKTNVVRERLFWFQHNLSNYDQCKHCNNLLSSKNFNKSLLSYSLYCSRKCQRNSIEYKNKVKETSTRLYGVDHPWKNKEIQANRQATNLLLYGESNPNRWGGDLFKQSMINQYGVSNLLCKESPKRKSIQLLACKNKRINYLNSIQYVIEEAKINGIELISNIEESYKDQTSIIKWKCKTCSYISDTRLIAPKCKKCSPKSKPEFLVFDFIKSILPDVEIISGDRSQLYPYELDVFIPSLKLAFEINGLYWHSSQYLHKNYHLEKLEKCKLLGIRLIHLWDIEILENLELVKSKILQLLHINKNKLNARDAIVKVIDNSIGAEFVNANHLQGSVSASVYIGLFIKDKLYSVMSFGKPRFDKLHKWELIRFCNLKDFNIRGGASKIFKFHKDLYNESIISYADARYSCGNLYEKLGMNLIGKSNPGYFYFNKSGKILSRYQAQKHKLPTLLEKFDILLSEELNMNNHNFYRVYDCGQLKYSYCPQ